MNSDKQTSSSMVYQPQPACGDDINLIDIYLTVKRNNKLFFTVIVLSFLISLAVTYIKYQSQKNIFSSSLSSVNEYVLVIEIGRVYGRKNYYIDEPNNILEKIRSIYIPKLNQTAIKAKYIKKSDLIVITMAEISDKADYNKILLSLADDILKDSNSGLTLKNEKSIKPTKIIQQPIKRVVKNKNKNINAILILVLGLILGIIFGFFAVFIHEFIKKVKEVEKSI